MITGIITLIVSFVIFNVALILQMRYETEEDRKRKEWLFNHGFY